jgi:hypothetical protein
MKERMFLLLYYGLQVRAIPSLNVRVAMKRGVFFLVPSKAAL